MSSDETDLPTRRSLVAATATLSIASAGCLYTFTGDDELTLLCRALLSNHTKTAVEAELEIVDDGTIIAEASGEIDPPMDQQHDGIYVPEEDLPTEPGRYRVRMRVTGEEWAEYYTPDTEAEQISVVGRITSETEPPVLLTSANPNECD